jgi:hypothetical protein
VYLDAGLGERQRDPTGADPELERRSAARELWRKAAATAGSPSWPPVGYQAS